MKNPGKQKTRSEEIGGWKQDTADRRLKAEGVKSKGSRGRGAKGPRGEERKRLKAVDYRLEGKDFETSGTLGRYPSGKHP